MESKIGKSRNQGYRNHCDAIFVTPARRRSSMECELWGRFHENSAKIYPAGFTLPNVALALSEWLPWPAVMGARQFQEVIGFPTSLEIWKNPSHPLQFLKSIFNFPVLIGGIFSFCFFWLYVLFIRGSALLTLKRLDSIMKLDQKSKSLINGCSMKSG